MMHNTKAINTDKEKKSVIITDYNETKFGEDILYKMCGKYNTATNS